MENTVEAVDNSTKSRFKKAISYGYLILAGWLFLWWMIDQILILSGKPNLDTMTNLLRLLLSITFGSIGYLRMRWYEITALQIGKGK